MVSNFPFSYEIILAVTSIGVLIAAIGLFFGWRRWRGYEVWLYTPLTSDLTNAYQPFSVEIVRPLV